MEKTMLKIIFGVLIFQHVIAAPSDVKLEDIAEVTNAATEPKEEAKPETLPEETSDESSPSQSPRQKRWYDFYGGFPPFNPGLINREIPFSPPGFVQQDPLVQIHRRLQDISNSFRQPQPPPQVPQFPGFPHFPAFVPFIYIPQVGCSCTPDTATQAPIDNTPRPDNQNGTDPDVMTRWPEMEDERQNWGIVANESRDNSQDNEDDGDGSRPISFDPIRPSRPTMRPPPPLEHGSVQGDVNASPVTTTTTFRPTTFRPVAQAPGNSGPLPPPTSCDSAILKCCLLPQVTYDCFALEGCPDPSSYGYPCENGVISRVIDRFLKYYGQRNG